VHCKCSSPSWYMPARNSLIRIYFLFSNKKFYAEKILSLILWCSVKESNPLLRLTRPVHHHLCLRSLILVEISRIELLPFLLMREAHAPVMLYLLNSFGLCSFNIVDMCTNYNKSCNLGLCARSPITPKGPGECPLQHGRCPEHQRDMLFRSLGKLRRDLVRGKPFKCITYIFLVSLVCSTFE
jgi:hypothetical protein